MPTLNWIGKEAVINHHDEVPIHTLTHDPDRSFGVDNEPLGTGNLLIEGDNLIALKALLPYYAGKVKCIIIDPPYNTGNENWIYDDNVNNPTIKALLPYYAGKEIPATKTGSTTITSTTRLSRNGSGKRLGYSQQISHDTINGSA